MNDEKTNYTMDAEELRAETAEGAPEVAEHDKLATLEAQIEDLNAKLLYAQAEMQNLRRRTEKEVADARTYAATGFARDMLSIADNLGRALAAIPAELREDDKLKPLVTGIDMTGKEIDTVFARNGVTKIEAIGQALDPNKHQAIVEIEHDDAPGTVVHEMQAGYMIKDRLLRPAMVGVAKPKA
jgi:molecular chaperone GrpE